jgi:hypothetical protein
MWSPYVPILTVPTPGNSSRLWRLVPAALVAVLVPFAPHPAPAAGHLAPDASAAFTLHGSNGFSIDVASERGKVAVIASEHGPPIPTYAPSGRPRPADTSNGAASIYSAPARMPVGGATRVEARLGRLGAISVAFHPSGEVRITKAGPGAGPCPGQVRLVRRLGTFTGSIEFRGEDGYTTVQASSARGSVGTPLPSGCASAALLRTGTEAARPGAVLRAVDRSGGVRFEAATADFFGAYFVATVTEHQRSGLVVMRRAYVGAPPSAFAFDDALASARVKPPAPFLGIGHYAARPGSDDGRWRGGLRVTFPGATIPLTGPGYRARLRPQR